MKQFTTNEVMRWKDLAQVYESELRTQHPGVTVFSTKTDEGNQRWKDLKIRVVEHVSTKYTLQNCESQPCRETSYYAELLKTSAFVLCFKWYKVVMFNCKCLCFICLFVRVFLVCMHICVPVCFCLSECVYLACMDLFFVFRIFVWWRNTILVSRWRECQPCLTSQKL